MSHPKARVSYTHRIQPDDDHVVEPTRDPGIPNPNRCGVCGLAILRTPPTNDETDRSE